MEKGHAIEISYETDWTIQNTTKDEWGYDTVFRIFLWPVDWRQLTIHEPMMLLQRHLIHSDTLG